MNRREFLRVATGAAGGSAVAGAATESAVGATPPAQTDGTTTTGGNTTTTSGEGTTTGGGLPGAGTTKTVEVGPNGSFKFVPKTIYVKPGTTVKWVWKSDFHNIVVESQPDGADWGGTPGGASKTYDTGYTYSHQFTTKGTYNYYCDPHRQQGMVGKVVVNESGKAPGGGEGGKAELKPHEMGVPFQAHFVGIATILMMIVSLVFTFFVLKYGESAHASAPSKE